MALKQEAAKATYTVYIHIFPNKKKYIGITSRAPMSRWQNGHGYKSNEYMTYAIEKYGWDNIKHEILATGLTKEEAEAMEIELIAKHRSNDRRYGYNITSGGESIGKHSEESKAKMREMLKGRPSCRKGKHHTEESKRKMSEAHKGMRYNIGVPFTEERKAKLRGPRPKVQGRNNPAFGRKWTAEELAIRQAHRIYKVGAEHPQAKKIVQMTKTGEIVKVWGSISEASKEYCRTSIKDVLKGKYKHHRGYAWAYWEEKANEQIS